MSKHFDTTLDRPKKKYRFYPLARSTESPHCSLHRGLHYSGVSSGVEGISDAEPAERSRKARGGWGGGGLEGREREWEGGEGNASCKRVERQRLLTDVTEKEEGGTKTRESDG